MARVEIYTKFLCGYCGRARALLDAKGAAYDEHDITLGGREQTVMIARSGGRTTVPQIFVDGQHIGGCDDLLALDATGELDALLASTA